MSAARIVKTAIPLLIILVIIAIGANIVVNQKTVIPPHIELRQTSEDLPDTTYSFPFEDSTVTLTIPVDPAVYFGARAVEKETVIRGEVSDNVWLEQTYLAMVNDPAQDRFYGDLLDTLRSVRDQQALSSDEYLELMSTLVQSIPYESLSENPPKFPVETFVDKSGDCDDKSLLLAGLLSREGYNISLLSFTQESHMVVGVVCPGGEYKQTGYAFIETTNFSFAGVPTRTLGEDLPITSDPFVIRIGNGTLSYDSCRESLYLDSTYLLSEEKVFELTDQINTLKAEMDRYYAQRDAQNYNERVPIFNNLQHTRIRYAELHNYILEHQYDRKGTFAYVQANLPE